MKAVEPVKARLELSTGVELVTGTAEVDRGHLPGWSDRNDECARFSRWSAAEKRARWVVRVAGSDSQNQTLPWIGRHSHPFPFLTTCPRLGKGGKCWPMTQAPVSAARSKMARLLTSALSGTMS